MFVTYIMRGSFRWLLCSRIGGADYCFSTSDDIGTDLILLFREHWVVANLTTESFGHEHIPFDVMQIRLRKFVYADAIDLAAAHGGRLLMCSHRRAAGRIQRDVNPADHCLYTCVCRPPDARFVLYPSSYSNMITKFVLSKDVCRNFSHQLSCIILRNTDSVSYLLSL